MNQNQQRYLVFLLCISVVEFLLYGLDKKKAQAGMWRIKESTLLGLAVCGGAAGALLGMMIFHHKTRKWYFRVINAAGLLLQILVYFQIA